MFVFIAINIIIVIFGWLRRLWIRQIVKRNAMHVFPNNIKTCAHGTLNDYF